MSLRSPRRGPCQPRPPPRGCALFAVCVGPARVSLCGRTSRWFPPSDGSERSHSSIRVPVFCAFMHKPSKWRLFFFFFFFIIISQVRLLLSCELAGTLVTRGYIQTAHAAGSSLPHPPPYGSLGSCGPRSPLRASALVLPPTPSLHAGLGSSAPFRRGPPATLVCSSTRATAVRGTPSPGSPLFPRSLSPTRRSLSSSCPGALSVSPPRTPASGPPRISR